MRFKHDGVDVRGFVGRVAALGFAVALAVALVACGGGGGAAKSGDAKASLTDGPSIGGPIRIAAAQGIPQLDPHKITSTWELQLYSTLWARLVTFGEDSGLKLQPDLAKSWKVSDDARTYTFTLRTGTKFSNGDPLTSRDVVGSLKRAVDPKTGDVFGPLLPKMKRIEAVDRSTVRVTLRKPSAGQFLSLVPVVPIVDVSALAKLKGSNPPTSGPYMVKDFVPGDHLTVVRNDNYWGEPAPAAELQFQSAPDTSSAVTSLRSKSLDALWSVPWQNVKPLKAAGLSIVLSKSPAGQAAMMVDNQSPPFNDVRARQALAYATDKAKMINVAYAGDMVESKSNQPIPPGDPYVAPSLPAYGFDLNKAKTLFAQAGVKQGDTLTFWTVAGNYPEWTTYGQILQSDLAKIGIKLKIVSNQFNGWAERFNPIGKPYPGLIVPNLLSSFPSPLVLTYGQSGAAQWNPKDGEYDALLAKADALTDEAQRKEAYQQAQRTWNEKAFINTIGQTSWPVAVQSKIGGIWEDPGTFTHFERARRVG
ncbi:MAG: peptide/nickel transport system substrate-binding protein [Solirubrobacteraceae bacterium]